MLNSRTIGQHSYPSSAIRNYFFALTFTLWVIMPFLLQIQDGPATEFRIFFTLLVVLTFSLSKNYSIPRKEFVGFILYCSFLLLALLSANYFSLNPLFSGLRVTLTVLIFFLSYFVVSRFADEMILNNQKKMLYSKLILIAFFLFIFIGAFLFPSFTGGPGGVRLTGGVNPNAIGFLAMVTLIWLHFELAISNRWSRIDFFLLLCIFIAVFWAMSRGVIVSIVIFYAMIGIFYLLRMLGRRKADKQQKFVLLASFFFALIFIMLSLNWDYLTSNFSWFDYIDRRLDYKSDNNLISRQMVWQYLLEFYYDNELFGGAGWYNATRLIDFPENSLLFASSPHNLYVRLLSEVGLVGAVAILALPFYVFSKAILNMIKLSAVDYQKSYKVLAISASAIVAIFSREIVEDSYATNYINLTTALVLFLFLLMQRHRRVEN